MEKMSFVATSFYLETTLDCFWFGISTEDELHDRLSFLLEASDDYDINSRIKRFLGDCTESRWEDALADDKADEIRLINPCGVGNAQESESDVLQLIIQGISGLSQWDFHEYDVDYFPSVPHGHNIADRKKLDAYLGWVYDKTHKVYRLKRKVIVYLWNNDSFRTYARSSIRWYMTAYPSYRWRVPYPLVIPRRIP